MKNNIGVIGLGNLLLQDDAIGLHAIETIKESYRFEPQIDLLDGGTAGLDLLPIIEDYEKVLFVDAVDAGQPPGAIVIIEDNGIPSFLTSQVSVHHVGLSDLLFAARMAGSVPAEICLIGVQPESVDIGIEMTDVLKESLDLLLATVVERLRTWGVKPINRCGETGRRRAFREPVLLRKGS
jgi:hydrogenase maturation protease